MLKWLDMQYLEINCACTDWTIGILNRLFIGYFWTGTQAQSFKCYFKPYITFQILRKWHDWNNVLPDLTDGLKTSLIFPKGIFPSMSSMKSTGSILHAAFCRCSGISEQHTYLRCSSTARCQVRIRPTPVSYPAISPSYTVCVSETLKDLLHHSLYELRLIKTLR